MPFIPVNMNDVVESKLVKNGRYPLQIVSCEEVMTKTSGKPQLSISIAIEGHEDAPNLRHYMSLPAPGDEPDKAKFKLLLAKRFCHLFKIPYGEQGFDTDQFIGATAEAEVTLSEPDESGNIYNRLNVPRLKEEASPGAASGGRVAPSPPKR